MNRTTFAVIAATMFCGTLANAQAVPVEGPQRVQGVVTALSDTSMTLLTNAGDRVTLPLLPSRTVAVVAPIDVDQIQPGSYVATANVTQPDGTGVSTEIRVFPPGTPKFDVNRVMDAGAQTMMTNGRVATAVKSGGGRLLSVDYGSGSRQITVPAGIPVISNTPGTPAMVAVGMKITVATFPLTAERPARQTITISKMDLVGR